MQDLNRPSRLCCSSWNEKLFWRWCWWWWVLEALWFPGDHTSPSFDRLWGAWRLCFVDILTIMVNCPEWLSFRWSTSCNKWKPPSELTGHYCVGNFSWFALALLYHLPRKTSTKIDLENAPNTNTNAILLSWSQRFQTFSTYTKTYFFQILLTNLSNSVSVSTSPSPRDLSAWF